MSKAGKDVEVPANASSGALPDTDAGEDEDDSRKRRVRRKRFHRA